MRIIYQSFVLAVLYVFASLEKLKSIKIAGISSSFLVWMVLFCSSCHSVRKVFESFVNQAFADLGVDVM